MTSTTVDASGPVNWNRDDDTNDTGVILDINNFGTTSCPANGINGGSDTKLDGHNDWANLIYNFRSPDGNFGDGMHLNVIGADEPGLEEIQANSPETDGDGWKDVMKWLRVLPIGLTDYKI